jgi:hypothetical protein
MSRNPAQPAPAARRQIRPIPARALAFAGAAFVFLLTVVAPLPASAHALGQTFQLPVPLALYLAGAGTAVAASFVVTAIVAREPPEQPATTGTPIDQRLSRLASAALTMIGLVWWYGAIAAGLLLGGITPLPAVLFWICIWVGLPIISVLIGNPWPSLSPFRSTFAGLEGLARRMGVQRLDLGWAYPAGLARWPAVALLAIAGWCELVLPGSDQPGTVAWLLIAYTLLTLLGMAAFGRVAWLRNAELLEVLLGWFGRIGLLGRRVTVPTVCDGCDEACDPRRCVDCPECAVAADPGERRAELRPWFLGLADVRSAGWSDAALIVGALAIVSYDGLRETAGWRAPYELLLGAGQALLGSTSSLAFFGADTAGLASIGIGFGLVFVAGVGLVRALGGHGAPPLGSSVGTYAATLLPIAGGYLIAHYLTLVLQGAAWLPALLADLALAQPTTLVAPLLDWMPISAVWYLSVGAIVVGHVAAVVSAHRIALRDAPRRPVIAGVPLVALMVGYTVLSLWIIAQPIVIEPAPPPAAIVGVGR